MRLRRRQRRRRRLRSEPGTRGYRGILAVLALIAVVSVAALTGVFQRGLCLIDASTCAGGTVPTPVATGFDLGELPAPTDELAVYSGAGPASVPAGARPPVRGQQARPHPAVPPPSASLWSLPQTEASPPSAQSPSFVALDALPCGSPATGPCDAWEGLESDSTAEQTLGPDRLALLGLDPFLGVESEETVVTLTLTRGPLQAGAPEAPVLYRHAERLRDGMSTTMWSWQDPADPTGSSMALLRLERSREGLLHSVTIVSASSSADGQILWSTLRIPVTDSSRDALEQWLASFLAQGPTLPEGLMEPTSPVTAGEDLLVRMAHESGEITREALAPGAAFPGLSPQALLDDPERAAMDLAPVSVETLSAADADGHRSFVAQEES